MGSRSFSMMQAQKAHLVRGSGGWQGEIADVRADAELGFQAIEAETAGIGVAQANIRLNTKPTTGDTVTIGPDVYEFLTAITTPLTAPTNKGVLIGLTAATALANIIAAINGAAGLGTTYAHKGHASVVASIYNTDFLHIEAAVGPGLATDPGAKPNIALSDVLTAVIAWDHANLSATGGNVSVKKAMQKIVVDAVNVAAAFDVKIPGTLLSSAVLTCTNAAGVVDTVKAAAVVLTNVAARGAVTVDLTGVGHPVATDIVYLQITYF